MRYSTHLLRHLRSTIGENIHRHRRDRRLPLDKLATIAAVPVDRLDRYELGKHEIRLDEMLRIACALDVGLGQLIADA